MAAFAVALAGVVVAFSHAGCSLEGTPANAATADGTEPVSDSATKRDEDPRGASHHAGNAPMVEAEHGSGPETPDTTYQPPYPHRTNPFARPLVANTPARTSGMVAATPDVYLRGFVDVDGPAALIDVGGRIFTIREGEEKGGVLVVEIRPPRATVQQGRRRWTARLFGED